MTYGGTLTYERFLEMCGVTPKRFRPKLHIDEARFARRILAQRVAESIGQPEPHAPEYHWLDGWELRYPSIFDMGVIVS